ncbi:sensor domain-containing diguanylate cyclase [Maridesulfovibrio salexigens]|uniref:Diguanylate cyclase with PAS/PAC sensor n=1 Tax=Maridesulfovibrio salexigens (strain ATCC 14822 / DSM 2638 / NCIMB 8403 / VKM B-1763) TaxID=526222 RepID=C6C0X5_MARSD|nr:diguanylate cyclase [Maridesulfovibrio salexigens]ACS81072.1 diguanylate cyclase with PAS/PAC sensor [Maridesulfovibrio salexigens DSM 2638]
MKTKTTSSVFLYFIKRFSVVAVLILAVSAWALLTQRTQYHKIVENHEVDLVKSNISAFNSWLESDIEYTAILAGLVEEQLTGPGDPYAQRENIAELFSIFGSRCKGCVQLRYFSPEGMELVRINIDAGRPVRVAGNYLQDKSERSYIKEAAKLKDEVYISSFDLNMEFGKVVIPYTPVIRIVKKVYAGGMNSGFLVINFSGDILFKIFNEAGVESFGDLFLVNDDGGWIVGPDETYSWKFLFKPKEGLLEQGFPEVWSEIKNKNDGQFAGADGLYTFDSLSSNSFHYVLRQDVVFSEGWKVISRVPNESLVVPRRNIMFILLAFLVIMLGYLFWRQSAVTVASEEIRLALEDSEKIFMDVADAAGEFIWETGPDGSFVFVTGRAEDVLGYSAEELIGRSPFDFVDEEYSWDVRKEFLDAAQFGNSFNGLVFRFVNRDGRKIWLEFNGVPVFDAEGVVTGFRGATSDISAQKKALQDLQDREDMLQSISDSVQDALVLMDEKGLVHFWNPAAEKIFGYRADEMLGESLQCCFHAEDNLLPENLGNTDNYIDGLLSSYGSFTVNVRRKGGDVFPAEVLLSPLRKDDQWWVVGTFRDVTERKEAEDKLRKLATTDSLTGLSNRRFFMESAEDALERTRRYGRDLSLLMMDIDYFKTVNDMYGHDAGDDVLKGLSKTGLKILRNIDVFGRIGGEEFSILLPDTGLDGATLVAERLRAEIETTKMNTRSGSLNITVSIGVATYSEHTKTLEQLLKAADIGLYAAKEAGRNQVKVQLTLEGSSDE